MGTVLTGAVTLITGGADSRPLLATSARDALGARGPLMLPLLPELASPISASCACCLLGIILASVRTSQGHRLNSNCGTLIAHGRTMRFDPNSDSNQPETSNVAARQLRHVRLVRASPHWVESLSVGVAIRSAPCRAKVCSKTNLSGRSTWEAWRAAVTASRCAVFSRQRNHSAAGRFRAGAKVERRLSAALCVNGRGPKTVLGEVRG